MISVNRYFYKLRRDGELNRLRLSRIYHEFVENNNWYEVYKYETHLSGVNFTELAKSSIWKSKMLYKHYLNLRGNKFYINHFGTFYRLFGRSIVEYRDDIFHWLYPDMKKSYGCNIILKIALNYCNLPVAKFLHETSPEVIFNPQINAIFLHKHIGHKKRIAMLEFVMREFGLNLYEITDSNLERFIGFREMKTLEWMFDKDRFIFSFYDYRRAISIPTRRADRFERKFKKLLNIEIGHYSDQILHDLSSHFLDGRLIHPNELHTKFKNRYPLVYKRLMEMGYLKYYSDPYNKFWIIDY